MMKTLYAAQANWASLFVCSVLAASDIENGWPCELGSDAFRHSGSVEDVVWVSDEKRLVSIDSRGQLVLWDADRGTRLKVFELAASAGRLLSGPADQIWVASGDRLRRLVLPTAELTEVRRFDVAIEAVATARRGGLLAVLLADRRIVVLEAEGGATRCELKHVVRSNQRTSFGHIGFSPSGAQLVVAADGAATIWDVSKGELADHFPTDPVVLFAGFRNERELMIGTTAGLQVWETQQRQVIAEFEGQRETFTQFASSPQRNRLAIVGTGGWLEIRDATTFRLVRRLPVREQRLDAIRFSASGGMLAGGGLAGLVRRWKVERGVEQWHPNAVPLVSVEAVAVSQDMRWVALADSQGQICLVDRASGAISRLPPESQNAAAQQEPGPSFLALSPHGDCLLAGSRGREMWPQLWRRQGSTWQNAPPVYRREPVTAVAIRPRSRRAICGGIRGTLLFGDYPSGSLLVELVAGNTEIRQIRFSADGKWFACLTREGEVSVWNSVTLEARGRWTSDAYTQLIAMSGQAVVEASGNQIQLRTPEPGMGTVVKKLEKDTVSAVIAGDDWLFLGGQSGKVYLWCTPSLSEVERWHGHRAAIVGMSVGPEGCSVLSVDRWGVIRVHGLPDSPEPDFAPAR